MPYVSRQNTQTRAISAIAVAVIQGGVVLLLVKGLAGVIHLPVPVPNPSASNVPITVPISQPDLPDPPPSGSRGLTRDRANDSFTAPSDMGALTRLIDSVLPGGVGGDGGRLDPVRPAQHLARAAQSQGGAWVSASDYPGLDLRLGHQGTTGYRLAVGPTGAVGDCTITTSSGWPGLDAATCRLARQRAHFSPALDDGGNAVAGSYSGSVTWRIPVD